MSVTGSFLFAAFLTLAVVILAFLHFALAVFHDRKAMAETKHRSLEDLNAEIAEKKEKSDLLDKEIRESEDLRNEVGFLEKRKERLNTEWEQLEERRKEVQKAQKDTEEALDKKLQAENDLSGLQEEFDQLREKMARLKAEEEAYEGNEAKYRKAKADYNEMTMRLESLRQDERAAQAQCSELEARRARLQDEVNASSEASEEFKARLLAELKVVPPVLESMQEWAEYEHQDEAKALEGVLQRLKKQGLEYHPRTVYAFHTAMKITETTQMAVLAGISGTGKSQLPRHYALGMGIGFLQVPVQPRWDSPQDLMGFYNYIEKRFKPTDLARALYQLDLLNNPDSAFEDQMLMVLLDEMNLARVEYYFSDFLSRLESRPPRSEVDNENLRKDAEIELEIPMPKGMDTPRIFPGYNLLFAGTMNEDESTQALSEKVIDRANILRFSAPSRIIASKPDGAEDFTPYRLPKSTWESWLQPAGDVDSAAEGIEAMLEICKKLKRPFGHRLGRSMQSYVANYPDVAPNRKEHALADQVEMRILPRIRGVEVDQFGPAFEDLQKFVKDDLDDDILAEAIEDAVNLAREGGTGQFVWPGVTRR